MTNNHSNEYYEKQFEKKIELLNREQVAKGTVVSLYKDTVRVNGNICYWDYLDNVSAAAVLPVLPNGNILLVRQYRLAIDRWTLEIPAGKLDYEDEDFLVCAKRELEEETGYKSEDFSYLIELNSSVTFWKSKVKIFVANNLTNGQIHFDRDEETKTEEWSLEDLKKEIYSGNICDSKTVAGIMAYIVKYGKM